MAGRFDSDAFALGNASGLPSVRLGRFLPSLERRLRENTDVLAIHGSKRNLENG
jgi:hypothetical protein